MGEGGGDEAEVGVLTGVAAAAKVGKGTGDDSWTGAGEGHSGLLEVGDGVIFSGFVSSGMKGSGKKWTPGDFTGLIYKTKQTTEEFRIQVKATNCFELQKDHLTCVSGSGDGLSRERTISSFCSRLMLDGSEFTKGRRKSSFPFICGKHICAINLEKRFVTCTNTGGCCQAFRFLVFLWKCFIVLRLVQTSLSFRI